MNHLSLSRSSPQRASGLAATPKPHLCRQKIYHAWRIAATSTAVAEDAPATTSNAGTRALRGRIKLDRDQGASSWRKSRRGGFGMGGREATSDVVILALGLVALLASAGVAISIATEPVVLMWTNPI